MSHAQFSFDDRAAADRAVQLLIRKGFPADRVAVHEGTPHTVASGAAEADELITGGFVTNLYGLFEGIFERDQTSRHAMSHGVHLEPGHVVVDVDADDAFHQAMAEQVREVIGCCGHGQWERGGAAPS